MSDNAISLLKTIAPSWSGFIAVIDRERKIKFAHASFFDPEVVDFEGRRVEELFGCPGSGKSGNSKDGPFCGRSEHCAFCGIYQIVVKAFETHQRQEGESSLSVRTGGQFRFFELRIAAIPLNKKGEEYMILLLEDITINKRKMSLEKIFYHDILNTISSLLMNISLIESAESLEESREYVSTLEAITDTLVDEIQKQRLITLAESGRLEVDQSLIPFPEYPATIIESIQSHPAWKNVPVYLDTPEPNPFIFISDKTLVNRILTNLIRNAVEASSDNQEVRVEYRREADGKWLVIQVSNKTVMDDGIKAKIFHQFHSTKGPNRGLGTYSVKLLTENYLKGTVSFVSDHQHGTRFTVSLPDLKKSTAPVS